MAIGVVKAYDRHSNKGVILSIEGKEVTFKGDALSGKNIRHITKKSFVNFEEVAGENGLEARNVSHIERPDLEIISNRTKVLFSIAISDRKFYRGVVKWFNKQKGYGFVTFKDTDTFVHHTTIADADPNLNDGEVVSFVYEYTRKGTKAIWILLKLSKI
jgi:cold shock protein